MYVWSQDRYSESKLHKDKWGTTEVKYALRYFLDIDLAECDQDMIVQDYWLDSVGAVKSNNGTQYPFVNLIYERLDLLRGHVQACEHSRSEFELRIRNLTLEVSVFPDWLCVLWI